jgi:protein-disulfide isomerase
MTDARKIARDKARALRASQKKKDKRNRVLLRSGIIAGIVAIAAVVTIVLVTSIRPPHDGPANMASDGVLITTGLKAARSPARAADAKPTPHPLDTSGQVVNIVTYVDYLCQYCGQFDQTNGEQIGKLVSSGAATLEIHPLPFYANRSAQGTQYSLRAANAAACVANYSPDQFFDFNRLMFEHEPSQTSVGLTDDKIAGYAEQAGAGSMSDIRTCIQDKSVTADDLPLVLVDGQRFTGSVTDATDFRAFIQQAQGQRYSTGSPTPTPTATATSPATSTPTQTATSTPTGTATPTP